MPIEDNIIIIKPTIEEMVAIVSKDYGVYRMPLYEHYNWVLSYLGITDKFVTNPASLLPKTDLQGIQLLFIRACSQYLKENGYVITT